ncbi:MAG: hypothetical protein AAGB15_10325 [Pseudomonadota bacterium]
MTAKRAGRLAALGFWRTLRRLRDQWLLLVFLATALFWMRDTYEQFVDLPADVAGLHTSIGALHDRIAHLEQNLEPIAAVRTDALAFPGTGHSIGDGRPGSFVTVRLAPAKRVRPECRATGLASFLIDANGRWFLAETDLARMPHFSGSEDLAFAVRVHPRMAVGRAQFLVQVTQDCSTHLQVDSAPRLHFRVLPRLTQALPAN